MTGDERQARAERHRELAAAGLSNRAIAARTGVDESTVRADLRAANPAPDPPNPAPAARVLPPMTKDENGLWQLPTSPDKSFVRCTCSHAAWRIEPGVDAWQCGCPRTRGCHPYKQIAGPDGTPQVVWAAPVIRPFP